MALIYELGEYGILQDKKEAFKWFTKAADNGSPYAQYEMALRYFNGDGVTKNLQKAMELMQEAAEGGVINAIEFFAEHFKVC